MTARKLDSFFITPASPLNRLALAAQQLASISGIWETVAPIGLALFCRIGRLDDGVLTLFADNGAIASKINQQLPSLLKKLQQRGSEITGIRIEVQVNIPLPASSPTLKSAISKRSLGSLQRLSTELDESPLKEALTNLIKRHSSSE